MAIVGKRRKTCRKCKREVVWVRLSIGFVVCCDYERTEVVAGAGYLTQAWVPHWRTCGREAPLLGQVPGLEDLNRLLVSAEVPAVSNEQPAPPRHQRDGKLAAVGS